MVAEWRYQAQRTSKSMSSLATAAQSNRSLRYPSEPASRVIHKLPLLLPNHALEHGGLPPLKVRLQVLAARGHSPLVAADGRRRCSLAAQNSRITAASVSGPDPFMTVKWVQQIMKEC